MFVCGSSPMDRLSDRENQSDEGRGVAAFWSNTALVFNLNACVYSVSLILSFAKLFVRLFLPVSGP